MSSQPGLFSFCTMTASMVLSGLMGGLLLCIPMGPLEIDHDDYEGSIRRRKIIARLILTWPAWGWFFLWLCLGAVAAALPVGLLFAVRHLWHMAFPGQPPSDWDGPSQGGAYR